MLYNIKPEPIFAIDIQKYSLKYACSILINITNYLVTSKRKPPLCNFRFSIVVSHPVKKKRKGRPTTARLSNLKETTALIGSSCCGVAYKAKLTNAMLPNEYTYCPEIQVIHKKYQATLCNSFKVSILIKYSSPT